MNQLFKILIFLACLWLLSYSIANILFNNTYIPLGGEIAVIPINGMITLEGSSSLLQQSTSASNIIEKIREANNNPNVKGIVLEINSPGGTVMGSKKIADEVKNINKPVVAIITEYGTSGAYWIASQSDLIVADELSIVGSIGVIGSYLDFSGLLDNYNVTYNRLVTGEYKDINSPMKEMTPKEKELVQDRLDSIHEYFVKEVAEGRHLNEGDVQTIANGLFYLGGDAKNIGLIDELGDKDYAIERTKQLANLTDGQVQEYKEEPGWLESIVKQYAAYSSFYIGAGIGSKLFETDMQNIQILAK